jgi:hypothetical protein
VLRRFRLRFLALGLIVLAGIALIGAGIICLYLSDAVVHGWWQGTLDAFGVGFTVGGLVDVLAISGLNQALTRDQKRRENNSQAEQILRGFLRPPVTGSQEDQAELRTTTVEAARKLLAQSRYQIDPTLRRVLQDLIRLADSDKSGNH